jgi:oxalate decarboxylase/phosphoglucose isomerase-like protein (cupin superfamily)
MNDKQKTANYDRKPRASIGKEVLKNRGSGEDLHFHV